MTTVERLQAAIDKLEQLKAESTPDGWVRGEWRGYQIIESGSPVRFLVAERVVTSIDAELIVTLHRTIDAQLAILGDALDYIYGNPEDSPSIEVILNELALADAILGGAE